MHPSQLQIKDFNYDLPAEKIAEYPLPNRDDSKLLIYKNKTIKEAIFKNLIDYLPQDTTLIFNNTKVIQARLYFFTSKKQIIEIFCLEPDDSYKDISVAMLSIKTVRYKCLIGNLKKWKNEQLILIKNNITVNVKLIEKKTDYVLVDFFWEPNDLSFAEIIDDVGSLPIPPYIKRKSNEVDLIRYQTIYAKHKGSVAAPTAGLHFTDKVIQSLASKNISSVNVTLHVGAGTFKPVKTATIANHEMHAEWIDVSYETIINLIGINNIFVVGTTSLRTIETLYWMGIKASLNCDIAIKDIEISQWDAYELKILLPVDESLKHLINWMQKNNLQNLVCKTQILIAPPYKLKIVKGIITNFHQPQSTLLLLISAIVGDNWKNIYDYALTNNFRFLSYGDSSLLFAD